MIDRNEGDSAVAGIVDCVYNWLFMGLWVTLSAGYGKAALMLFHVLWTYVSMTP